MSPIKKKKIIEAFKYSIKKTGSIKESVRKVARKLNETDNDVQEVVDVVTVDIVDKYVIAVDGIAVKQLFDTEEEAEQVADTIVSEAEGEPEVMEFEDALEAGVDLSQVIEIDSDTEKIVLEIADEDIADELGTEEDKIEPESKETIEIVTAEIQEVVDNVLDEKDAVSVESVEHIESEDGISTYEITLSGDDEEKVETVTEALKSHLVSIKSRKALKENAIRNVARLKIGENYKFDSGIGGIMTAKYKGQKNGKHIFENVNKVFKNCNFSLTSIEAAKQACTAVTMVMESKNTRVPNRHTSNADKRRKQILENRNKTRDKRRKQILENRNKTRNVSNMTQIHRKQTTGRVTESVIEDILTPLPMFTEFAKQKVVPKTSIPKTVTDQKEIQERRQRIMEHRRRVASKCK